MTCSPWTDDRVRILRALWLEGRSAAEVAQRLGGVTRNAVIGKVHRLGLAARTAASSPRPRRAAPSPARRTRPTPLASPPPRPARAAPAKPRRAPIIVDAVGRVFDLSHLSPRMCRWPIGDPKAGGFSFCGEIKPGPGPYCPAHAARAYRRSAAA